MGRSRGLGALGRSRDLVAVGRIAGLDVDLDLDLADREGKAAIAVFESKGNVVSAARIRGAVSAQSRASLYGKAGSRGRRS